MGIHVEWLAAADARPRLISGAQAEEDLGDASVPEGNLVLCLGVDDVVAVQGTKEELAGLARKILAALDSYVEVPVVCEWCRDGDHSDCTRPIAHRGDPRGDDYEVVRCCCAGEDEMERQIDDLAEARSLGEA